MYNSSLPKKSESISDWYNAIITLAELADYGPTKGTMIIRPYGYALWETIQAHLDAEIKKKGVDNAYFPLLIPESLLEKEKTHVDGFSPELAVVTIGGGEELAEKLIVRPTSETIICQSFAKWVQSWRDLPIRINQWCNVVRWEKRTYMFLRTTEFLWQEGHTIHATHAEAKEMVEWAISTYARLYRELLAVPGIIGRKSEFDKFAGGDATFTLESLMPDGKALQNCTSHDLGQNFAKVFDIKYQDQEGKEQLVWQSSWGLTTRAIGGMLLTHGDDRGLCLPPRVAPIQVVILPVRPEPELLNYAKRIEKLLQGAGIRVKVDDREGESIGFRINKWEQKGVPLRLELGGREKEGEQVTVSRRDQEEKSTLAVEGLAEKLSRLLEEIQAEMYARAENFMKERTHTVDTYDQFKEIMAGERGFLSAFWCEEAACEATIKEETKASTRCLPIDAPEEQGTCVCCGKPAKRRWYFGQSY